MTEISAITLLTDDMSASIRFWSAAGLEVIYGGSDSRFTSLRLGDNFVNLLAGDGDRPGFWGRVILHVPSPDDVWAALADAGYPSLTEPADAPWGERYFHIVDPGGHEISFARRLDS